jgi:hypothetical protein
VSVVGFTTNVPFSGNVSSGSYNIVGREVAPGETPPHGRQETVGGDYFKAMGIPLLAGRYFNESDVATAPPVVIIDEYLVNKYFAGKDPLGQQIRRGGTNAFTIVGVVRTISSIDLAQPVTKERLYYPASQQGPRMMSIMLKTSNDRTRWRPTRARHPHARSRAADRRREDDGGVDGSGAAAEEHADTAAHDLRRRRARAVGDREFTACWRSASAQRVREFGCARHWAPTAEPSSGWCSVRGCARSASAPRLASPDRWRCRDIWSRCSSA